MSGPSGKGTTEASKNTAANLASLIADTDRILQNSSAWGSSPPDTGGSTSSASSSSSGGEGGYAYPAGDLYTSFNEAAAETGDSSTLSFSSSSSSASASSGPWGWLDANNMLVNAGYPELPALNTMPDIRGSTSEFAKQVALAVCTALTDLEAKKTEMRQQLKAQRSSSEEDDLGYVHV